MGWFRRLRKKVSKFYHKHSRFFHKLDDRILTPMAHTVLGDRYRYVKSTVKGLKPVIKRKIDQIKNKPLEEKKKELINTAKGILENQPEMRVKSEKKKSDWLAVALGIIAGFLFL